MGGTTAVADAAASIPNFDAYPIDSVKRADADGAGHRSGNAIDLAVPYDQNGWNYLNHLAQTGVFQHFGTKRSWVPILQHRYPNLDFFPDDPSTGADVHLHVSIGPDR